MVDWLAIGKGCPEGDDGVCLCCLLTSAVYYAGSMCKADAKHYVGMGLPADNNHCCLRNRNSSKPNPSVFAQTGVPLPALSPRLRRALQKPAPAGNRRVRTRLPARLRERMGIPRVYPGLSVRTVFTADAETLKKAGKKIIIKQKIMAKDRK